MQLEEICLWLRASYWAKEIPSDEIRRSIVNSTIVLGAFSLNRQIGFLRVVSDKTRFAYLADVWVADQHRRQGVATKLVRHALTHPDLIDVRRWLLATADQHEFYARLGFTELQHPRRMMARDRPR